MGIGGERAADHPRPAGRRKPGIPSHRFETMATEYGYIRWRITRTGKEGRGSTPVASPAEVVACLNEHNPHIKHWFVPVQNDLVVYTLQDGPCHGKQLKGLQGEFIKIPYSTQNGIFYHVYERRADDRFHFKHSTDA